MKLLNFYSVSCNIISLSFLLFFLLITSNVFAAGTIELPRTGQTTCYVKIDTYDYNVIDCWKTGQNGDNLAGVSWPDPRFTDNSNGTITDNLTGLIWLKNANCSSGNWSTAISSSNSLANGSCGLADNSVAGDWRLPNINELESLFNAEESILNSWLNSQGFTNVQAGWYWSSTTSSYPTNACCAMTIPMYDGEVSHSSKTITYRVWPVRAVTSTPAQIWKTGMTTCYDYDLNDPIPCNFTPGQDGDIQAGVSWPDPRFTDNSDGTVTDNLTGLIWLKDANCASGDWSTAISNANSLANGSCGLTDGSSAGDWRLPNRKELHSLIDQSQYPALPSGHPFTNVQGGYWSSTTYADTLYGAWNVSMSDGEINAPNKKQTFAIWSVRGGVVVVYIPTLSEWGIIIFTILILLSGIIVLKKKGMIS